MTQSPPERLPSTLVHIGMPKCGSTWLQRQLFKPYNGYLLRCGPVESKLAFVDGGADDWHPPENVLRLKRAGGRVPTISGEMLAGDPLSGGSDRAMILSRLQQTVPRARILIVIREQADMFRSLYKLLVNWGYGETPRELIRGNGNAMGGRFHLDYLSYHTLIDAYQQAFGRNRVLVLPFEMFQREPSRFLTAINQFSDSQPAGDSIQVKTEQILNPGRKLASLQLKRLYNRYLARTPYSPRGLYRPADIHSSGNIEISLPASLEQRLEASFHRETTSRLREYFRDSNRFTAELTGLDLSSWGYSCGETHSAGASPASNTHDSVTQVTP